MELPDPKLSWDKDALRQRALELSSDIRLVRSLVDEALTLKWDHIVEWAPLTSGEKVWRRAHHASSVGDLAGLRAWFAQLPTTGYPTRVQLLLPHLGAVARTSEQWRPLLEPLATAGMEFAADVLQTISGKWDAALAGGAALAADNRKAAWLKVREQLEAGTSIPPPGVENTPAWTAASLLSSQDRTRPLDAGLEHLLSLEPPLVDDLIDEGRLTSGAALMQVKGSLRSYLLARLDPAKLDDDETKRIGHTAELARRYFLRRDRALLSGMEATPRVIHYQALLDVIEGGRPDPSRLDPAAVTMLELPTRVLGQIKDGAVGGLPDSIARDPSLWPMFTEQAIDGKLKPDAGKAPNDPLNLWIGLLRLLGLVWERKFPEAVEHGKILIPHLAIERQCDEAQNLTAFALDQLGRIDDSLKMLEDALQGEYTENLLVNVAIVAAKAQPDVGVRYLVRLVEEAPTPDQQRAGLYRAIDVWLGTEVQFPKVLVPALRSVLNTPLSIDDYIFFGGVAVAQAPAIVPSLSNPGGELAGPYRLIQARAKLSTDKNFFLSDLAKEFIASYKSVGRPEWFNAQWSIWVNNVIDGVHVDFGEAMGCAEFIDQVLMNAPELFSEEDRFLLAAQAGAHYAAFFAKKGATLSDQAWRKFLFGPLDEFFGRRHAIPDGLSTYLTNNFAVCLAVTGFNTLGVGRDDVANSYNPLVERLRWDSQNRYAIVSQMDRVLGEALQGPIAILDQIVDRIRRLDPEGDDARKRGRGLAQEVDEWRDEIHKLRRNL